MMKPAPTFLTTQQAAQLLQLSPHTLEKMRVTGNGPTYVLMGRLVRYRLDELMAWADAGARRSTSDPGPDHGKAA